MITDRGSHPGDQRDFPQPRRGRVPIVPFVSGTAIIAVILSAYHALTWTGFTSAFKVCVQPFCDFVDYYYPMGEAVFRTGLPVEGFLYSPFIAILMAVFPLIGLDASLVAWGILQLLAVVFTVILFRRLMPSVLWPQLLFVALLLSSYPIALNYAGGQVSVFTMAALFGMFLLYEQGHNAMATGLLAFAVSFKFFPFIFLALFAAGRDYRSLLLASGACVAVLFLIPGFVLGFGDTLAFYGALLDAFRGSDWVVINPHSQFFPHVFLRYLNGVGIDGESLLPFLHGVSYALAAVTIGFLFLIQRARLPHANLWSFMILFLTIPFFLKTSWAHDFFYLPFVQALMTWRLLEGEQPEHSQEVPRGPGKWWERIPPRRKALVVGLLMPSILLSNVVFFNLFDNFSLYGGMGFLFWANIFILITAYVELLPPALQRIHMTHEVSAPHAAR